ncbi:hypothetical protein ACFYXH_30385 [Streptomyces sp. NPDC002730]|uniref:hypothetical protein n=1 Tax=Streptomyces sp. NPDC002730 TaxID=3364662 RepID=UPI00369FD498
MSARNDDEHVNPSEARATHAQEATAATPEEALRKSHAARTRSAAARAAAISHYIEQRSPDEKHEDEAAGREVAWKAAHAARLSAQAVATLSESAPDPAADARCARNAAAAGALAAQMGQLHDGAGDLSVAANRAALKASQAAADAAGKEGMGTNAALNATADAAEADAVAAAEAAGWMKPGHHHQPQVSSGMRSPELLSMMHL